MAPTVLPLLPPSDLGLAEVAREYVVAQRAPRTVAVSSLPCGEGRSVPAAVTRGTLGVECLGGAFVTPRTCHAPLSLAHP